MRRSAIRRYRGEWLEAHADGQERHGGSRRLHLHLSPHPARRPWASTVWCSIATVSRLATAAKLRAGDETTLSVVEVIGGGQVHDVQWREVLEGSQLTSASLTTTTGPALLVAWSWGDAGVQSDKTAVQSARAAAESGDRAQRKVRQGHPG